MRAPSRWRIAWDDEDGCWRVELGTDHGLMVSWERVLWLRFASREAAEQHVVVRGLL